MKGPLLAMLLCALAGTVAAAAGAGTPPGAAGGGAAALSLAARHLEGRDGDEGAGDGGGRDDGARLAYFETVLNELRAVPALAPLFDRYGVPDPIVYDEDAPGLGALLQAVRIRSRRGTLTITNRETGGVVFAAPLWDLPSGSEEPEHLPGAAAPPRSW